jgi:hypothetical protein
VPKIVDFYVGAVYPGVLSEDGDSLPDGVPLAIPFSQDTPDDLKTAVAQFWQWTNFQAQKSVQVRYCAALGNVLGEICDDVDKGKVFVEYTWPGFVSDVELDECGNLKRYVVEFRKRDGDKTQAAAGGSVATQIGQYYVYRKEVEKGIIRYYRDGEPYDYGNGAVVQTPYDFVAAVWYQHSTLGGIYGLPAISGSLQATLDELNSMSAMGNDQIKKLLGAPNIIAATSANGITGLINSTVRRGATDDFSNATGVDDRDNLSLLRGPADTTIHGIPGNIDVDSVGNQQDRMIAAIKDCYPEAGVYDELRKMSSTTGPSILPLFGDVANKLLDVAANYDQGNISLFRMAVAIAGHRYNEGMGGWAIKNRQQAKFANFDLDSYQDGDLQMAIMPRPLIGVTKKDMASEQQAFGTAVSTYVSAGMPLEFALTKVAGFEDEEVQEMSALKQQAQQDAMQQFADKQKVIADNAPPQLPPGNQDNGQQGQDNQQGSQFSVKAGN